MKKRIYRAVDVKALNLDELREVIKNQKIVLGVDVAKEDFFAALMNEKREVLSTIKWKHPMETGMLLDVMLHKLPWSSLDVAMEPSGTYGDALRALFLGNGIKVYRVSPKRCHDAAEVYDGVPSLHDPKAAAIIGRLHLDGASEEWPLPENVLPQFILPAKSRDKIPVKRVGSTILSFPAIGLKKHLIISSQYRPLDNNLCGHGSGNFVRGCA